MYARVFYFISGLLFFALAACGGGDSSAKNDRVLAKVYDKTLYASDMASNIPSGTSDSMLLAAAFVKRWVSDQLLMYEAERNIPKDANIDQLVRDYRASLVRFNFEEQLIAQKLDSTVSEQEVRKFYESKPEQFQLESTILKCLLIKVPASANLSEFNDLWNSRAPSDFAKLTRLANQQATLILLNRDRWYKLEEIAAILPKGTLTADNISSRKEGTLSDGDFRYFYRVLESVRGKDTAPFDYVKEQATKVILHHRKQDLLDQWKRDLYDSETRRGNVQVF